MPKFSLYQTKANFKANIGSSAILRGLLCVRVCVECFYFFAVKALEEQKSETSKQRFIENWFSPPAQEMFNSFRNRIKK